MKTKIFLFLVFVICSESARINHKENDEQLIRKYLLEDSIFAKFGGIKHYSEPQSTPTKRSASGVPKTPVVIVPSLIGSQLWAKLDKGSSNHWYCAEHWDWYQIFISNSDFYPYLINCWMDNMGLYYNETDQTYNSPQGVYIRLNDYGGVSSVTYVDDSHQDGVWDWIVGNLTEAGYTIGVNVRSAPYDWRIGPNAYATGFAELKKLVEETYSINNNSKVALASLSMGGNYAGLFLNKMTQAWKDQYIHSFTSLSGAFGGSAWAVEYLISKQQMSFVDPNALKAMVQAYGSIVWLSPFYDVFKDEVIVYTPSKNYTAADLIELFTDAGTPIPATILRDIKPYLHFDAPGVPTNCIMGYNISSPVSLVYNTTSFDQPSSVVFADGDGTVSTAALNICSNWEGQQKEPVNVYRFANMGHAEPVHDPKVIDLFLKIVGAR